jgi:hypothetical protein
MIADSSKLKAQSNNEKISGIAEEDRSSSSAMPLSVAKEKVLTLPFAPSPMRYAFSWTQDDCYLEGLVGLFGFYQH